MKLSIKINFLIVSIILLSSVGCSSLQRKLLYHPTHIPSDNGLQKWVVNDAVIGYCREVKSPKNVWLMFHGNGGQAAGRASALPRFSKNDSVYILEYPGYGTRKGKPSTKTFNKAASEAYRHLRNRYQNTPVCIVGESIGSGPASFTATLTPSPDKVVLIVPFDKLSLVAKEHLPAFFVWLMMSDDWDNIEALSDYDGPVEVYGAVADNVIPVSHAKRLSDSLMSSTFTLLNGGHNDWSLNDRVKIRNQ